MGCAAGSYAAETAPTTPPPPVQAPEKKNTLSVQCPQGAVAGSTIQIQAPNGQTLQLQVPAGIVPGQTFSVAYDPDASAPQQTSGLKKDSACRGKFQGQKCGFDVTGMNFCTRCGTVTPDGTFSPLPVPLQGLSDVTRKCIHCDTGLQDVSFCPGCGIPAKHLRESCAALPMKRFSACLPVSSSDNLELTGDSKDKLALLLGDKPYVNNEHHALHSHVVTCQAAISSGNEDDATNALDNLTMALANEERTLANAFRTFDASRNGVLSREEVKLMLDYCSFPSSEDDAMLLLESGESKGVTYDDFLVFVGNRGGSAKLFEMRRQRIAARRGSFHEAAMDPDMIAVQLKECGFSEDAQTAWKTVVSGTVLEATAGLEPCQKAAIRHIRALAQESSERAMPHLLRRVVDLGFSEAELMQAILWIRDLAPIIVHVNIDKIGQFLLNDTHYRNQFETASSSGLLKPEARMRWEKRLFGQAYEDAQAFDRPKYAVQNVFNDFRGVMGAKQYGDSYLVLQDVRLRCTMCPQDSANLPARRLAVLDFYGHALLEYSDSELKELFRVAKDGLEHRGDSAATIERWGTYKEAQVHGPISFKDNVRRIVVNERHRPEADKIQSIAEKHGWLLTWMDDWGDELRRKSSWDGKVKATE